MGTTRARRANMFVKWKRRPVGANRSYGGSPYNEQHLIAVLVRSERVDGKPRQKLVKYLGTIRDSYIEPGSITNEYVRARAINAKEWFWRRVSSVLAETEMTPSERERAEAAVAA